MKLTTTFPTGPLPFEGDRELVVRGIPENARITSARVRVRPTGFAADFSIVPEPISFLDPDAERFGATRSFGAGDPPWVEVDFHARRTLASVSGSELTDATLQVDMGGAFVEINRNGAVKSDSDESFELAGDNSDLPGLTVLKFKITATGAEQPVVDIVRIRSVGSNLSFRIGQQASFWTVTGELTTPNESPDFSDLLQAFLAEAEIENGFYVVPLIVHSDTLTEMEIVFELEFVSEQSLLSPGVDETVASFDSGGALAGEVALPTIRYPANTPIAVRSLSGRIEGVFDASRIASGPRGTVTGTTPIRLIDQAIAPTLERNRPSSALAQTISVGTQAAPNRQVAATGFDVLVSVAEPCRLQLDVRRDSDGRPSIESILPAPIAFSVEPRVAGKPVWSSVPLAKELILGGLQFERQESIRYWLVLQSVAQDSFDWHATPKKNEDQILLRTKNGGASWSADDADLVTLGDVAAVYRVRHEPAHFTMPIELRFGTDEAAGRLTFEQFAPLGRVDVSLDFPAALAAVNEALEKVDESAPKPCPEVEHVVNGDFGFWIPVGTGETDPATGAANVTEQPEEWNVVSGRVRREEPYALLNDDEPTILSQVFPVQASCSYEFSFFGGGGSPRR